MSSHRKHRCRHCGQHYSYQLSGYCPDVFNDPALCGDCAKVVKEALSRVPKRFEPRWRNIDERPERFGNVTLERVLAWEQSGYMRAVQRIWPGLMDLDPPYDRQVIRLVPGAEEHQGTYFRLSTWLLKPDFCIEVEEEYDLLEGRFTGQAFTVG